jgi:hypothetical protein
VGDHIGRTLRHETISQAQRPINQLFEKLTGDKAVSLSELLTSNRLVSSPTEPTRR